MQRLDPLTSLRFFAAASILLGHLLSIVSRKTELALVTPQLFTAVSFFFVLSGFILAYVYRDLQTTSVRQFYAARIARIWPVHLLTFILAAAVFHPGFVGRSEEVASAILNLVLLQSWVPLHGIPWSFNAVAWTISVEVMFYALFPLLARAASFRLCYVAIAGFTFLYLASVEWLALPLDAGPLDLDGRHLVVQMPLARLLEFATGIAACRIFLRQSDIALSSRWATALEAAALAAVVGFVLSFFPVRDALTAAGLPLTAIWYTRSGGMLAFAALILIFAHGRGAISGAISGKWFVLLGEISFATYMVHNLILSAAHRYGLFESLGLPAAILSVVAATYLASYLVWRYVECPGRSGLKSLLAPPQQRLRMLGSVS